MLISDILLFPVCELVFEDCVATKAAYWKFKQEGV
jgi:hypothetical protein